MTIACPACNGPSEVVSTRGIRRRRQCLSCRHRWSTQERLVDANEFRPRRNPPVAPHLKWRGRNRGKRMTNNPMTNALLDLVERSGFTDKAMCEAIGFDRGQISRFRSGQSTPTFEQASWILQYLGASFTITPGANTE